MNMPSDNMNKDTNAKPLSVVVLGKGVVGKTSLIYRFVKDAFPEAHDPTIEDYYKVMVEINNESIKIQIVDTPGEEDYQNMLDQWIDVADGFLLVFAINDKDTFNVLDEKYKRIEKHKEKNVPIILVGNKCDLENERQVTKEEANQKATAWKAKYIETSALTDINKNCKEPFIQCAKDIKSNLMSQGKKELKDINDEEEIDENGNKIRRGGCKKCIIF